MCSTSTKQKNLKEVINMSRIYTFKAGTKFNNWDDIIANGDTETVREFDTYEEATAIYEAEYNNPDVYGVE